MVKGNIWKFVVAIGGCLAVGLSGSFFTFGSIPTWYATLTKPALTPPSWVFGPVWTLLYIFMGIAAFLIWKQGLKKKEVRTALLVFLLQLGLNFLWSILFFGLLNPAIALVDIVLMWGSIVWTIVLFRRLSRPAAYLLLPYLAWVSFATYLNAAIWVLNG